MERTPITNRLSPRRLLAFGAAWTLAMLALALTGASA